MGSSINWTAHAMVSSRTLTITDDRRAVLSLIKDVRNALSAAQWVELDGVAHCGASDRHPQIRTLLHK